MRATVNTIEPTAYALLMHGAEMRLVAREVHRSGKWRWQVVDAEGNEVLTSSGKYASVGEALEAGREPYYEVIRRRTPRTKDARGAPRRGAA